MIEIRELESKKELLEFIDFAWRIYKNDDKWVPPIRNLLLKTLQGINNPLFERGPHIALMAYKNGKPVARLCTGINKTLNEKKDKKEGYFTLFEAFNDFDAVSAIFDYAIEWLKKHGIDTLTGPVSPTNGDDQRGILIKGFDGPPVLMNSYTPPYYLDLLTQYGFYKDMDLLAYYFDPASLPLERFDRVVNYAMKKFGFHIDKINPKAIDKEIKDIKYIIDRSMPESWQHLTPPSLEEINKEFQQLKPFMDPDLLYIARSNEGQPIGFVVALPDYNQVIKRLNGKLGFSGIVKFLYYKRKINGMRIFIQFVIPEFRNKAVNGAIFYKLMLAGIKKGYKFGEGSTIAEMNKESIRSVEGAGGKLYRVYRIYQKDI